MPQARLPDVNTAFITYRREAIVNIKSFDHRGTWGALNSINALLPQKYRVTLDNDKFAEASKVRFIYSCGLCKEQTGQKDVTIVNQPVDALESLVTDELTKKIWYCKKCDAMNILSETEIIKDELETPSYLHVVPIPPVRKNGLLGRGRYRKEFTAWAWNFLNELEERMAQFRDDNWSKEDDYKDGSGEINTDEEESTDEPDKDKQE